MCANNDDFEGGNADSNASNQAISDAVNAASQATADSEAAASADATADRGAIYFTDKDGKTLPAAVDQETPTIWASPKDVADPQVAAATLAPILNMSVTTLESIFKKPNDTYETLIKKADAGTAQAVSDKNISGVYTDVVPERFYPLGTVGSQVLGYVGPNASNKRSAASGSCMS